MHRHLHLRRAVVLGAIATLGLLVIGPARAELRGAATTLAAQPAPSSDTPAASHSAACTVATDQVRFDFPLPRTARLLVSGLPIKIVALGSSSTYGAGASTRAACYPSRLAEELVRRFPGHKFTVLNRGVNGEELLHAGLARLKAIGADVVLIDPQYAPKVIAKRNAGAMVSLIAATAKTEHVSLFHRFDLMRHWHETEHLPFRAFLSPDGLHMNDWSYACLAKALGLAIAEAAERPTETAIGPSIER